LIEFIPLARAQFRSPEQCLNWTPLRSAEGSVLVDRQRLFWDDMTTHPRSFFNCPVKIMPPVFCASDSSFYCARESARHVQNELYGTKITAQRKLRVLAQRWIGCPPDINK